MLRKRSSSHYSSMKRRKTAVSVMPPIQPVVSYRFPCSLADSKSKPSIVTKSPSALGELVAAVDASGNSNNSSSSSSSTMTAVNFLTCPFVQFADGVQSTKLLESTRSIADLQSNFANADALVLEVWITPIFRADLAETSVPIVSVATPTTSFQDNRYHPSNCDDIQFTVSQLGNQLEISYKDFYDYFMEENDDNHANGSQVFGCNHVVIPNVTLKNQDLNHIVILWKQAGAVLQIYVNGVNVVDSDLLGADDPSPAPLPYDLLSWDPTYKLQLFSNIMSPSNTFPGLIHKVSLYNQNLLADDIDIMYHEGLEDRKQEFIFDPAHPLRLIASSINISNATLVQGGYAIIGLGGDYNISTPFWNIMVEFLSLPRYGELVKTDDLKVREVGERVIVDGGLSRVKIVYQQTRKDFFSIPKHSYHGKTLPHDQESFDYRLIAVNADDPEQLFGWSQPVRQMMEIVHQNHPPSLEVLGEVVRPPGGQPKEVSKRPFATLGKVVLEDDMDYDIDRVRVDLWALNGTLSIVSDTVKEMADFESCSERPTSLLSSAVPWQCHGVGRLDANMTFLATPQDASVILSNVQYNAFHWNQSDVITLRVFDGSGGSCLTEEEHLLGRYQMNGTSIDYRYQTVHTNCYEVVGEIQVPPLGMPLSPDLSGISGYLHSVFVDWKDWTWADAFSWGFLILLVYFIYRMVNCCGRCCAKCIRHRHTAAIHVENNRLSRPGRWV